MTSKQQALGVGALGICIGFFALIFALGGIVTPTETTLDEVYLRTDATNQMEGIMYIGVDPTWNTAKLMVNKTTGGTVHIFTYNELLDAIVLGFPGSPYLFLGDMTIPFAEDISCLNGVFTLPNGPSNPAGVNDCWYNATSDILWIYNGSAWNPH